MHFQYITLCSLLLIILNRTVWCNDDDNLKDEHSLHFHSKRPVSNNSELYVKISSGLLMGRDNGNYYSYESVPYAEAPLGKLRFEAPQPYRQRWKTVYNASGRSKPCMQWNQFQTGTDLLAGVEDCLTVNIHKPKGGAAKYKYPVMVFIHGGCFMYGNVVPYDPIYMMNTGKIIVVYITHRLGPLGFLSTEDQAITGNFGLKDQQLALRWIQTNIAAFGGNPRKVMLTGFSAGGAATHLQLLHRQGKDLMRTAISFSGVALNPWVIIRNARRNAFKMAELLKCPKTQNTRELKSCLQSRTAEDIVSAVQYFLNYGYNPFTTFGPVVEHWDAPNAFMTQHPRDIIKSGNFSHRPWLAAHTAEDGSYNAAELLRIDPATGREFMYTLNASWPELAAKNLFLNNIKDNPEAYALELKKKYLGTEDLSVDNYLKVQKIYTDVDFKNGILESIALHSKHSKKPVYGYVYDNPANSSSASLLSGRNDIAFGTNHFDDISLILKYPVRGPLRPDEEIVSEKLVKMAIEFVETENLSYGNCKFENNVGKPQIKLLWITKDNCKSITPTK